MGYRKYQIQDTLKWKKNRCRGAFFHEPGLGKTYVAIRIIKKFIEKDLMKKTVVTLPSVLIPMWLEDMETAGIDMSKVFFFEPKKPNKPEKRPEKNHRVFLIGYKLLAQRYNFLQLRSLRADFYIIEESHNVKSHQSKVYKILKKTILKSNKVLLLSGTPFPQGRIETFAQMDLIQPGILGRNITAFRDKYCIEKNPEYHTYDVREDKTDKIDKKLYKYCTFRKTTDNIDLPPVTYSTLSYRLTTRQKRLHNMIKRKKVIQWKKEEVPLALPVHRMLLMQQITSGILKAEIRVLDEKVKFEGLVDRKYNNKENLLLDQMDNVPENDQVLIWTHFIHTGERVTQILKKRFKRGSVGLITGKTPSKERTQILKRYKNKKIQFLVAHPKTLGTGFNMFSSTRYIHWYECTNDFAVYEQANRRIWRIGQKRASFIYHYQGINSIDLPMFQAVRKKKDVHDYVFDNYIC